MTAPARSPRSPLRAARRRRSFQINLFWIIVAATNFILFFFLIREFAFAGLSKTLEDRRARIEQGLKDAEQARRDRESAEQERLAALQEARREANEIINRAQKVAAETREQDIAATREELARMKERATAEIEAEKQRAIAELRGEVTDLALARRRARRRRLDDLRPPAQARRRLPGRLRRRRVEQLMSRPVAAARRYAEAAFEVALAENQLDRWQADLAIAADMLGRPDVEPTVHSPAVPLAERLEIVRQLLEPRIARGALRLVTLVVERGKVHALPRISERVHPPAQRPPRCGHGDGHQRRARSPQTRPPRSGAGSRRWPVPGWTSARRSNPDLIGGLTIQVRDRLLDASIRGRLERLRDQLHAGGRLR